MEPGDLYENLRRLDELENKLSNEEIESPEALEYMRLLSIVQEHFSFEEIREYHQYLVDEDLVRNPDTLESEILKALKEMFPDSMHIELENLVEGVLHKYIFKE
jgi:hypothetical protein